MRVLAFSITLAMSATAAAQPAEIGRHQHLGAASCASSVCHGKIAPTPGRNVALNEYGVWAKSDAHSRAYRTLESPLSRRIAGLMGLGSPKSEKLCLDCHADNVPSDRRGPKFQLSDGVSCEACHGGAEKWIQSHAATSRTHKENVDEGMYPSARPVPRAQLCLSCHQGTKDKFANHLLMAAGHPRLAFELEAYTTNQPAHFVVDEDYKKRKGVISGMNLWLTGQIESARTQLTLQQGDLLQQGMFPELALYDCHSCHQPMDRLGASKKPAGDTRPGAPRLQTQNLVVLTAALATLEPPARDELARLTGALVKAGQQDAGAARAAASALLEWLKGHAALGQRAFSKAEIQSVRKALVQHAATANIADYAVAEQLVLGMESLSYSIGDRSAKKGALDKLFAALKDRTKFNPAAFLSAAKAAQGKL